MAIRIIIFGILLIFNSYQLFSQNRLASEDSLFSFIEIKSDSIISVNHPDLKGYKVKMSFTINSKGKLLAFSILPKKSTYSNLQKKITETFCKLNYKEIYDYLYKIPDYRINRNVIFEIVYKYPQ